VRLGAVVDSAASRFRLPEFHPPARRHLPRDLGVFLANSETFGISIPTDVVFAKLESSCVAHEARSPEHLETLLENLERWSNVSRTQDTSLARTIEDLKRKRSLWRITEEGRLAEEAARRIEATFGASGALRSNLLAALGVA